MREASLRAREAHADGRVDELERRVAADARRWEEEVQRRGALEAEVEQLRTAAAAAPPSPVPLLTPPPPMSLLTPSPSSSLMSPPSPSPQLAAANELAAALRQELASERALLDPPAAQSATGGPPHAKGSTPVQDCAARQPRDLRKHGPCWYTDSVPTGWILFQRKATVEKEVANRISEGCPREPRRMFTVTLGGRVKLPSSLVELATNRSVRDSNRMKIRECRNTATGARRL